MTKEKPQAAHRRAERPRDRRVPGMRLRLFAYLALFCAFTIVLLWVFQIVFLGRFYEAIMLHKMTRAEEALAEAWEKSEDESFSAHVFDISGTTGFCISVYRIEAGRGTLEVKAHEHPFCLIHNAVDDAKLTDFYNSAREEAGKALFRFDEKSLAGSENGHSIVSARITPYDGGELMTLVNCDIVPVDATVSTLQIQLAAVTVILLLVSAVLASVISRHLSRPVSRINEEAKHLAAGDYSVHFDGGGYREIAELAETLNVAARELGKVDAMQKELIANISHDLRTPLTMISGYGEVMRDIPGEMTAENMQIVLDETARLTSLVNDVLDLSRLTSGQVQFKPALFSLTALVRETMKRYAKLRERDGYEITFRADAEVFVESDETRISQVICNLVNNAINYTGDDRRVFVEQSIHNNTVRISVSDTGEGIPEEKLPLIWERYYKASEYHRRGAVGTGLGLSIVKGVLDRMGGAYGVSSTVGEGSTFWFELPISDPPGGKAAYDLADDAEGSKPVGTQAPLQDKGDSETPPREAPNGTAQHTATVSANAESMGGANQTTTAAENSGADPKGEEQ